MDKERFNTTVVLSHVTPGPVYVLTSRALLDLLHCVLLRFKITLPAIFMEDFSGILPCNHAKKYVTVWGAIQVVQKCRQLFLMMYFSPDTQTYIRKLEEERRAKERGKGKDNRSFFAKYVSVIRFELLNLHVEQGSM